jgi:hypothetical protein
MAQVSLPHGSGAGYYWRKCRVLLAQVWFWGGDLRRKTGICALQWRRSPPYFHTCANDYAHLRRQLSTPAPQARYTWFSQIQAHMDMPLTE